MKNKFFYICSYTISFILTYFLYFVIDAVPFGEKSLAIVDGYIQYIDFFMYYKDVINGNNSFLYTLSAGLGQSHIGFMSYYLMSPFNLIIIFFEKTEIVDFFQMLIALKLSMCSLCFCIYAKNRFKNISNILCFTCSLCYAFMYYNISQCSNIMWLDGVYILPIIMLGVYRIVAYGTLATYVISTMFAICIQWYTAGITMIFSFFYFIVEIIELNHVSRVAIYDFMKYCYGNLLSLLLSSFIFYPVILSLSNRNGTTDLDGVNLTFRGNILSAAHNYCIGGVSDEKSVCLYCGIFIIFGIFLFFQNIKKHWKYFIILIISLLFFYWQPFYMIFSLLKQSDYYFYRYSYTVSFLLLFLVLIYFNGGHEFNKKKLCFETIAFSLFLIVYNTYKYKYASEDIAITILFLFIYTTVRITISNRKLFEAIILCICIIELLINSSKILNRINVSYKDFQRYVSIKSKTINDITNNDPNIFRISSTTNRTDKKIIDNKNITANYNEALSFNYKSISIYSSCVDNIQTAFLDKIGYKVAVNCATIVNTSILPVDTLLGVKYLLSKTYIKGYEIEQKMHTDYYDVFVNKHALPLSILVKKHEDLNGFKNSFEYINAIYKKLAETDEDIFIKVNYTIRKIKKDIYFVFNNLGDFDSLYGNIYFDKSIKTEININGLYKQNCTSWLSPSIIYIPTKRSSNFISLSNIDLINIDDAQFYSVNIENFSKIVNKIRKNNVASIDFKNDGFKYLVYTYNNDDCLLITVPAVDGLNCYRNGNKINIEKFCDCFISIPLTKGENIIEINFTLPGKNTGLLLTFVGVILTILQILQRNKYVVDCDTRI